MTKRKKVKKMTNVQGFSYPSIDLKFNKDLIIPNSFPMFEVGRLIWGSLLGKDNKELTIDALLSSPKFNSFAENTREDFIANNTNFRRFPKMDENDWE